MNLQQSLEENFDAVIAFDNAIAHLPNIEQLQQAFTSMKQRLKSGGCLLVSARDYDQLKSERPTGTVPKMIDDDFGKRIYFQTWDWNSDNSGYLVNLFVLQQQNSEWVGKPLQTAMRAFTYTEILGALQNASFNNVHKLEVGTTLYYQPVFAGRS